jgi:dihydroorotase
MNLLIKQARIIDPLSPHHNKVSDILIKEGKIHRIDKAINEKTAEEFFIEGLHVSPGWVDIFSNFADPGYEYKETLQSGAIAAAAGGFTDVMLVPNTKPPVQNKGSVEYIIKQSRSLPVDVHPIGCISNQHEGKELAEMYDMQTSGALAFSDGLYPLQSSGLMVKALQYVKAFNGIIIQLPDDRSIQPHGLMNEGIISTQLGLPGKPAIAEELMITRDIELARYTKSRIHFTGVTTSRSIQLINEAKKSGIDVSCSVTPHHLFFCDEDLSTYDTNLKVSPPLRSRDEMMALRKAVMNDKVDCIAAHHFPHEADSKVVEFEYARTGMSSLETAYAALQTIMPELTPEKIVQLLSIRPRKLFRLPGASISEGNIAVLSFFDPSRSWTPTAMDMRSKSKNSAFIGKKLSGRALGIYQKNLLSIYQ